MTEKAEKGSKQQKKIAIRERQHCKTAAQQNSKQYEVSKKWGDAGRN
jgi:hypothetical protein